jgi:UDP-GlcNAc:undecaprenyl-phosphate GlcNAc-1-phosphate transferase
MFLGDSGSLLVGCVLGVTAITGMQKGATSLAVTVPLLIFALPLAETASSATRRLLERPPGAARPRAAVAHRLRHVLEADRAHFHHRLIDFGLSPRNVVLLLYGVSIFLSLIALATARVP